MSTFKCKMCGGTLEIQPGQTVAECEYCGTQQTLPKLDDDRRANLYDRANHFRRNNEFDKAMGIYENILNEDNTDAEAYWSLVLCRYGIEYVEDPATHKRVPTVNRAQFTSVFDDDNYKSAIQYADSYQRNIYEAEAKAINEIQKGILAISQQEEPFDVFICYKESDNNGRRTPDSVLANDLYHQLTQEGFKVFFARITLEDKLGSAYEPYIFAALNSAKVMVVLGTKPEYFSAVWVKNEWSRYLALVKQGQKKMLIPAYKDMDPYDLPEEFSHLQAQDMGKLGFMQDLIRGIKKITQVDAPQTTVVRETVISEGTSNTAPLLKRVSMFLEDGDWTSADEYCEKVLDIDPENGEAYLGKVLAQEQCRTLDAFVHKRKDESKDVHNEKLLLETNNTHVEETAKKYVIANYLEKDKILKMFQYDLYYSSIVSSRKRQCMVEQAYWSKHPLLNRAEKYAAGTAAEKLAQARNTLFDSLAERIKQAEAAEKAEKEALLKRYSDFLAQTDAAVEELYRKAVAQREEDYKHWLSRANEETNPTALNHLAGCFIKLADYKDSAEISKRCLARAEEERAKRAQAEENARKEAERVAARNKKIAVISAIAAVAIIAFIVVLNSVIIPNVKYNKAISLLEAGRYKEAVVTFEALDGYKDSLAQIEVCNIAIQYDAAVALMDAGSFAEAYEALIALDGYKDSVDKANSIYDKYKTEKLRSATVGDYVIFGSYEQDNDTSNGTEDIEWLVLEKSDNKILVISKYALDCKPYNTEYTDVTWETCSLRTWLNKTFLNTAFSSDEQAMIPTVTVSADKNPEYSTNPGNATQDKVFLLSITEANKYFSSDSARMCQPTAYAVANGAYVNSSNGNCWWRLRSPGYDQLGAAYVNIRGGVNERGDGVNRSDDAVRPALWINLDS